MSRRVAGEFGPSSPRGCAEVASLTTICRRSRVCASNSGVSLNSVRAPRGYAPVSPRNCHCSSLSRPLAALVSRDSPPHHRRRRSSSLVLSAALRRTCAAHIRLLLCPHGYCFFHVPVCLYAGGSSHQGAPTHSPSPRGDPQSRIDSRPCVRSSLRTRACGSTRADSSTANGLQGATTARSRSPVSSPPFFFFIIILIIITDRFGILHLVDLGPGADPGTGKVLGTLPEMTVQDTKEAINHAHQALKSWRKTSEYERSALLTKIFQCVGTLPLSRAAPMTLTRRTD